MKGLAGCCLAGLVSCVCVLAGRAEAAPIVPHRAVYELSFERGSNGGSVADVNGVMQFEWADACDGWAVTQRSVMTFLYSTGEEIDFGWSLVSWEAKDGLRYRFFMKKMENGMRADELRGEARLDGEGRGGVAEYSLPARQTMKLPPGTMFPTAHVLALLERAGIGERLLWSSMFDGSDEEGLFGVNAVIMRQLEPEKATPARPPLLMDTSSWRIRMAFFGTGPDAAVPEHEQSLRLHANGVVEELLLDYGDFSVEARLTSVEALPRPPC